MSSIRVFVIFCIFAVTAAKSPPHGKVVACPVMTGSSRYLLEISFPIDKIDWSLCSHVIVYDDKLLWKDNNKVDYSNREDDYKSLVHLKKLNRHLKITKSVNAVEYYKEYLKHIKPEENTTEGFLNGIVDHIESRRFDGIDLNFIDLEDSVWKIAGLSKKKDTFAGFLRGLKLSFQKSDLILTASFSASVNFFSEKYDFNAFNDCFELVHISQFCFNKPCWSNKVMKYAMDELTPSSIQDKVEKLIDWGLNETKIVVGVQFGGPSFIEKKKVDEKDSQIDNIRGYDYICKMLATTESSTILVVDEDFDNDTRMKKLRAVGKENHNTEIIYYVRDQMIANTMRFAINRNLAGGMSYMLEYDDFDGACVGKVNANDKFAHFDQNIKFPKRNVTDFPLLRTLNEAISLTIVEANYLANITDPTGSPNQPQNTTSNDPTQGANDPGSASNFTGNLFCMALILFGAFMSSILST